VIERADISGERNNFFVGVQCCTHGDDESPLVS
jgi:hypothetical protein